MEIKGKHIIIYSLPNRYFSNIIAFVLEYFDKQDHQGCIIVLSAYLAHTNLEVIRRSHPGKRIIVYNWEQLMAGNTYLDIKKIIDGMRTADEIWDYDTLNADYLGFFGIKVHKIYNFKYTQSLKRLQNKQHPEIDVLIYGYLSSVRLGKMKDLYSSLYHKCSIVTTAYLSHDLQDRFMENSKIILNLHGMEPYHRQEQDRIGFCLINEKCVLSEPSQINYFGDCIVEELVPNLPEKIKYLLEGENWRQVANKGYKQFKNKED